jgi:hypothetical protein
VKARHAFARSLLWSQPGPAATFANAPILQKGIARNVPSIDLITLRLHSRSTAADFCAINNIRKTTSRTRFAGRQIDHEEWPAAVVPE